MYGKFIAPIAEKYSEESLLIRKKAIVFSLILISLTIVTLCATVLIHYSGNFPSHLIYIYLLPLLYLSGFFLVINGKYTASVNLVAYAHSVLLVLFLYSRAAEEINQIPYNAVIPVCFIFLASIMPFVKSGTFLINAGIIVISFALLPKYGKLYTEGLEESFLEGSSLYVLAAFILMTIICIITNSIYDKTNQIILKEIKILEEENKKNLDLNKIKNEAELANKAKSEFLANMSHEIRTPLSNIHGYIQLIENTTLSEQQHKFLDIINRNAKNLLGIINDVLDFSKIESGKMEIDFKEFNPQVEFQSVIELFYLKALTKKVTLSSFVEPNLPVSLYGDSLRIKQVLTNLLSNAIKFTPEGGYVIIEIAKTNETPSHFKLHFSVQDTGIGISDEKKMEIFKSFIQEHSSITGKYGGTGLGLSISSNLVGLMESELSLKSEKGKGSTFYFKLNFEKSRIKPKFSIEKDFKDKIKLAILDISEKSIPLCDVLNRYLSSMGFSATIVENIESSKNQFDIIFLVPSIDTQHRIKSIAEKIKGMKVIALVNDITYEKSELQDRGVTDVITQPLNTKKILRSLSFVMGIEKTISDPQTEKSFDEKLDYHGTILVAEDNIESQELVSLMLQGLGLTSDVASNGMEAIEKIKKKHYSLIFLDINMPVYNGTEVVAMIREHEKTHNMPHTPVVALTAMAVKGDKERLLKSGMDDYIIKPLNNTILNEVLNKWLIEVHEPGKSINKIKDRHNTGKLEQQKDFLKAASMELGVSREQLLTILRKAIPQYIEEMNSLKTAINNRDYESIYQFAHKLRGSFSHFLLHEMTEICHTIGKNSKYKKEIDYISHFNKLNDLFNKFSNDSAFIKKSSV